jgi:hypothetical protein
MKTDSKIIDFSKARERLRAGAPTACGKPPWGDDIHTCCAYARMLRAEHDAESARIHYEAALRASSWSKEDDLRERTAANNLEWDRYIGVCAHLARLPASTRGQAQDKRNTIGRGWLSRDSTLGRDPAPGTIGQNFHDMRAGCLADDHLFPPSMRLARGNIKKGG